MNRHEVIKSLFEKFDDGFPQNIENVTNSKAIIVVGNEDRWEKYKKIYPNHLIIIAKNESELQSKTSWIHGYIQPFIYDDSFFCSALKEMINSFERKYNND